LRQELTFETRTRRPPRDPANALLSLAYTLLTNAIFTACEVAGLDAYDGFFHADKYGRPALALDLVEEFRPIVADSAVLKAVNNRMVGEEDFEYGEDGGVYLAGRSLKVFLAQFGKRLNTPVFHPDAGRALSYQKVFEIQARRLRKCIESGEPGYEPFVAK
jgi:CRISPR-associated protein Cas1